MAAMCSEGSAWVLEPVKAGVLVLEEKGRSRCGGQQRRQEPPAPQRPLPASHTRTGIAQCAPPSPQPPLPLLREAALLAPLPLMSEPFL